MWRWALGARWSSSGLLGSVRVGDVVIGQGWMASGLPPVWVGVQWSRRRERRGVTTFMRDGR
jgi:hypothetical protein